MQCLTDISPIQPSCLGSAVGTWRDFTQVVAKILGVNYIFWHAIIKRLLFMEFELVNERKGKKNNAWQRNFEKVHIKWISKFNYEMYVCPSNLDSVMVRCYNFKFNTDIGDMLSKWLVFIWVKTVENRLQIRLKIVKISPHQVVKGNKNKKHLPQVHHTLYAWLWQV